MYAGFGLGLVLHCFTYKDMNGDARWFAVAGLLVYLLGLLAIPSVVILSRLSND
jgi:hypothetical protein